MFQNLKQKIAAARAEGTFALAELALERGQDQEAVQRFIAQARDLKARGLPRELQTRGWAGALQGISAILQKNKPAPHSLHEILKALSSLPRHAMPREFQAYSAYRPVVRGLLLQSQHKEAIALCHHLNLWFPSDPRPRYALGRALEASLPHARNHDRQNIAQEALNAYDDALLHARQNRSTRWTTPIQIRTTALLMRHLAGTHPETAQRATQALETLTRTQVRNLSPHDQIVVAQAWLSSAQPMRRLRALDLLEEHIEDPALTTSSLRILHLYLERMDWRFYSTEHNRAQAILKSHTHIIGHQKTQSALLHLDLIHNLHEVMGRHSKPNRQHLLKLHEASPKAPQSTAAAYYQIALAISDPNAQRPWKDTLREQLTTLDIHPGLLRSQLKDSLLTLALASLAQIIYPDRRQLRAILEAFTLPTHQHPHAQAAFALLLPSLLAKWADQIDLQTELRNALGHYLQAAPPPSYGFSPIGMVMLHLNEKTLAEQAAQRAQSAPEHEDPQSLKLLRRTLAAQELRAGNPEAAVLHLLS